MLRRTVRPRPPRLAHRLDHVGLGLEHLVAPRVVERLAREPHEPEPVQVVEVGGHAVEMTAAGLRADHRSARARRAARPCGSPAADVDRRLRPVRARAGAGCAPRRGPARRGCARTRGGASSVVAHVGRAAQQLGAALAQGRARVVGRRLGLRGARLRLLRRGVDDAEHAARPPPEVRRGAPEQLGRGLARRRRADEAASRVERGPHRPVRVRTTRYRRCARCRAGRAAGRLRSRACSSEDRQVEEAGAEAEHRAVEIEQPLVLAHRRAQHLREVARTASRACARR